MDWSLPPLRRYYPWAASHSLPWHREPVAGHGWWTTTKRQGTDNHRIHRCLATVCWYFVDRWLMFAPGCSNTFSFVQEISNATSSFPFLDGSCAISRCSFSHRNRFVWWMRKLVFIVQSWSMGDALGEVELREVPCSSARWGWECWEGAVWIYFWPFLPMLIFMLVSWGTPLEARGSYGPEIQHAMSKCKLCSPIPTPTHTSWCYHIHCFRVKDLLRSTPHRSHPSWQKFDQIWPVGNGWLQVARGGRLGWCKVADRSRVEAYRSCRFCKLL